MISCYKRVQCFRVHCLLLVKFILRFTLHLQMLYRQLLDQWNCSFHNILSSAAKSSWSKAFDLIAPFLDQINTIKSMKLVSTSLVLIHVFNVCYCFCLQSNANVKLLDHEGRTCISYARNSGVTELIDLLLNNGCPDVTLSGTLPRRKNSVTRKNDLHADKVTSAILWIWSDLKKNIFSR